MKALNLVLWLLTSVTCYFYINLIHDFLKNEKKTIHALSVKINLSVTPQFTCEMTDLRKVQASLQALGTAVVSAGMEFVPRTQIALDEDQLDAASTLVEALNEYPDVVRVWDNIQADSWNTPPGYSVDLFSNRIFDFFSSSSFLPSDHLHCFSWLMWKLVWPGVIL